MVVGVNTVADRMTAMTAIAAAAVAAAAAAAVAVIRIVLMTQIVHASTATVRMIAATASQPVITMDTDVDTNVVISIIRSKMSPTCAVDCKKRSIQLFAQ